MASAVLAFILCFVPQAIWAEPAGQAVPAGLTAAATASTYADAEQLTSSAGLRVGEKIDKLLENWGTDQVYDDALVEKLRDDIFGLPDLAAENSKSCATEVNVNIISVGQPGLFIKIGSGASTLFFLYSIEKGKLRRVPLSLQERGETRVDSWGQVELRKLFGGGKTFALLSGLWSGSGGGNHTILRVKVLEVGGGLNEMKSYTFPFWSDDLNEGYGSYQGVNMATYFATCPNKLDSGSTDICTFLFRLHDGRVEESESCKPVDGGDGSK